MSIALPAAIAVLTGIGVLVLVAAAVVHRRQAGTDGSVTGIVTVGVVMLGVALGLGLFWWLLPELMHWTR